MRAAAGTGRIHENDVRPLAGGRHLLHILSRVAGCEPAVFDTVEFGVDDRVLHRVAVQLDSEHLPGLARGAQPDRPDTAVGVQHKLLSRQTRHFNGDGIEPFGLDGVYLIKRARGYAEAKPQQGIFDIPVAEEHLLAGAENHGAETVVDVQHNGRYLGVQLGQLFQERLLKLEYRGHCDEDDHDLTALEASADEYMAQPSGAGSLVESLNFEAAQHIADIDDDAVGVVLLHQTLQLVVTLVDLAAVHEPGALVPVEVVAAE